jgi:5'-deoxynucleotidase YfbR-like HD superfamily hydrolase
LLFEAIFSRGSDAAQSSEKLAALLHDAPEYVIGDMISPFKAQIGGDYKRIENRLLEAILVRFGLSARLEPELVKAIKAADRQSAFFEATRLAGFSIEEARKFFGAPKVAPDLVNPYLRPWRPEQAQKAFLARFAELDAVMLRT